MNPLRRLAPPIFLLLVIIAVGISGYIYLEGYSFLEAFYMLVITLSTVGFREVRELSPYGKLLTINIIILGVGTVAYTVWNLIEIMMEGQIIGYRRRKAMERRIKEMKNHYIISGFGRVGHQVAEELKEERIPFVVIDGKEETAKELTPLNIPHIIGDVAQDEVLEEGGIKRAKGLIACADSDEENVFVTLSARSLNPNLYIIVRSGSPGVSEKLKKAGADRVLSPYFIAGRRMAALALMPVAGEFLDMVMKSGEIELALKEYNVNPTSPICGKTILDSKIKEKAGATILAIKKQSGLFELQPTATSLIEAGDVLIAIGNQKQLELIEGIIK